MKMVVRFFLFAAFSFLFVNNFAQSKKLTYKQTYQFSEPRLTKTIPRSINWFDENNYLETKTDPAKPNSRATLVKINAETGNQEILIDYAQVELPEGFALDRPALFTKDYESFLFNQKNDFYLFIRSLNEFKRITFDGIEKKNPKFSPDGKKVAYTKNNDLYFADFETEKETRLTFDGSELIYNGWASWVYMEEILGRATNYAAFWWSPKSDKIAFLRFDDSPVPEFFLTKADGKHGVLEKQRYPKAGDPNPFVKLGIADLKSEKVTWADFEEKADQYIAWPFWTPENKLTVQWMNRGQNNIIINSIDENNGSKKEIYNEKQNEWVEWFEDLTFLQKDNGFILRSTADGYAHLYLYDISGKLKNRITSGEWEVKDIHQVDEKNKRIFFHAWKDNSTERHLFVVDFSGKNLKQLTKESGTHACAVSPGGKYFIDRFSSINSPAKINLYNYDGKLIRNLYDSKNPSIDEYALAKAELFTIPTTDGFELPASWYLPADFDPNKKYPVIISIYGGPDAPSVRNSFPFWLEGYYLAQNGIIYMSVDHRGTGHFGKKGVALMHRKLGDWEINDYIETVNWLKKKGFVDTTKIAINGGSYGGYVTALALTKGADYFTHGIAEFGVMDWHLYDNVYTERYMDTPEENPEGYKSGSVLTYANKYKGKMLITHGTMDDNVHMQNSIQLIYELQKQNKDFEVMFYPNSRHGIGFPLAAHYAKLKTQFWFKNLLNRELDIEKD